MGRAFSSAVVETTLASYPGTYFTAAPSGASEVARYWPTLVRAASVVPVVDLDGEAVALTPEPVPAPVSAAPTRPAGRPAVAPRGAERVEVPLGILVGARSGDKGGNANIGVWADDGAVFSWVAEELDESALRTLLPETAGLAIERYELANLAAVNFVIHGILGWGVASTHRGDTPAMGIGERLRSRPVAVPAELLVVPAVAARRQAWEQPVRGKVH